MLSRHQPCRLREPIAPDTTIRAEEEIHLPLQLSLALINPPPLPTRWTPFVLENLSEVDLVFSQ